MSVRFLGTRSGRLALALAIVSTCFLGFLLNWTATALPRSWKAAISLHREIPDQTDTSDVGCPGGRDRSMFHPESSPPFQAGELVPRGPARSNRNNAKLLVKVEANSIGFAQYGRVIRVLSEGMPDTLVGRQVELLLSCTRMPKTGETGVIIGTLWNEEGNAPSVSAR